MLKNHSLGFLLFLFCSLSIPSQAQNIDPHNLESKKPIFSHQYTFLNDDSYYFIDTLFDNLKEYHKWNNANADLFSYSAIGSMGTALNQLTLNRSTDLWSYYNFKGYNSYFLEQDQIKYYNVKSALTQANYWMGYDVGQRFQIFHTQNINDNWNFLIDYSRLNDLGFYNNNLSKEVSFLASSTYESNNGQYKIKFNFFNQNLNVEENGGISQDSVFESNLESNRTLFLINLDQDNRTMRNRELFVNHELNVNLYNGDSLQKDSLNNNLWLGHDFKYSRRSDTYRGVNNGDYYENYFGSTTNYLDSSFFNSFVNSVYLRTNLESWNDFKLKVGAKNIIYNYGTDGFEINDGAFGLIGTLFGQLGRFQIQSNLDYILSGNLRESLDLNVSGQLNMFKAGKAEVSYNLNSRYPNLFKQVNYSDNYIWNNDLRKVNSNELAFRFNWKKANGLEISNTTISNFTYYDETFRPEQHQSLLNLLKFEVKQNFLFGNLLHFDNRIIYQLVNNEAKDVLPLPEIVSRNALYFQFRLFNNALKCLVGGEVKYFSKYYSPTYSPALGDFIVKREKEIGNYPVFDVFANFKISSAIVFFKFEHVNQGLNSYSYYAAPHYPFPDRIFRVGISWRFFN